MRSQFVIWAAGEFQYPNLNPFPGAKLCIHNSQVRSWADLEGDESTLTPGLFVVGSSVRHGNLIFCFIYKFRQRFAVVANAIANKESEPLAQRLGINPTPLQAYRQAGLFLDYLSCCTNDCVC